MITPLTLEQRVQARLQIVLPILQGLLASGNYPTGFEGFEKFVEPDPTRSNLCVIRDAKFLAADLINELEKDAAEEIEAEAKAELADHRTAEAEDDRIAAMKKQIGNP